MTADPWQHHAACRGLNPNTFVPATTPGRDTTGVYDAALAICAQCPVAAECLDDALERREADGVWGGTTPAERRRIIRRRSEQRVTIADRVATAIAETPDTAEGVARRLGMAVFTVREPLRRLVQQGRAVYEQEHHNTPRVYRLAQLDSTCGVTGGGYDEGSAHMSGPRTASTVGARAQALVEGGPEMSEDTPTAPLSHNVGR